MAFYTYPFFFFYLFLNKTINHFLPKSIYPEMDAYMYIEIPNKGKKIGDDKIYTHIYIYVFINKKKQTIIYNIISDTLNVMMNMKL